MAIKKLQNDYTTQEQSKRLLELGVPADTANMHYHQECVRMEYGKEEFEYFIRYGKPDTNKYSTDIPCWSVGRLIDIFEICTGELFERKRWKESSNILLNDVLEQIELAVINTIEGVEFDFSKLEEGV